jgi:hypothetical protein
LGTPFRETSASGVSTVVVLQPVNMHWIQGAVDDPKDLCGHGDVVFRIGDDVLLETKGKDLTVSAAALYLLRTLSVPHTQTAPVGDHLFPCCGFAMWDLPDQQDVAISGCPNGEDFEVVHEMDGSGVIIRAIASNEWKVGWPEWRAAVFRFADEVAQFYANSYPKEPSEEFAPGFRKFGAEWQRRRGVALR